MKLRMPRCPECPYTFIKPSKFRWFEWPSLLLMQRPYRCGCCKRRFFGRFSPIAWWLYARAVRAHQREGGDLREAVE
jgi:hypothetical protein